MKNYLDEIEKKLKDNIKIESLEIVDNSFKHRKHKFFDSKKIVYSGNPVRESIKFFKSVNKNEVYEKLNLNSNKKTIIID